MSTIALLIARFENLLRFPVPVPVAGKISLRADATIPLGKLRTIRGYAFHGDVTLAGASLYGVDVGRVSARLDLADGVLVLSDLRGRLVDRPGGGLDSPPEALAIDVPRTGPLPPGGFRGTLRGARSAGTAHRTLRGPRSPHRRARGPRPAPPDAAGGPGHDPRGRRRRPEVGATRRPGPQRARRASRRSGSATPGSTSALQVRVEAGPARCPRVDGPAPRPAARGAVRCRPRTPHAFRARLDVSAWDLARTLAWRTGHADEILGGTFSARGDASGTLRPRHLATEGQGRFDRLSVGDGGGWRHPLHLDDPRRTRVGRHRRRRPAARGPGRGPGQPAARPRTASHRLGDLDRHRHRAARRGPAGQSPGHDGPGEWHARNDGGAGWLEARNQRPPVVPELTVQGIPAAQVEVALSTRERPGLRGDGREPRRPGADHGEPAADRGAGARLRRRDRGGRASCSNGCGRHAASAAHGAHRGPRRGQRQPPGRAPGA